MDYPSGRRIIYGHDTMGRVNYVGLKRTSTSTEEPILSWVGYLPFGGLRGATLANGLSLWSNWDREYRLDGLFLQPTGTGTALLERYHWVGDGLNLLKLNSDALAPTETQTFTYDDVGRLLSGVGPYGTRSWTYDQVGNRLSETRTVSGTTTSQSFTYPSTSNRLASIAQGGTTVRSLTHDAAGNLTSDTRSGVAYATTISDAGRISQVTVGGVVKANYLYDHRNRLSVRQTLNQTPSGTVHLVHDHRDRVIAEVSGGQTVREYVWLDEVDGAGGAGLGGQGFGLPVAVLDGSATPANPTLLWVQADHLGRPERLIDSTKAVQWKALYLPFGEVHSVTGPASLDLRFPGQWFQLEAGLAYNWHRHYDASLGRYTQPDPLGLETLRSDGPSAYGYALSSPMIFTDPEGLRINRNTIGRIIEACILAWGLKTGNPDIKPPRRPTRPPITREVPGKPKPSPNPPGGKDPPPAPPDPPRPPLTN